MAKILREGRTRSRAPSHASSANKGEGTALMLMVPAETLKTLRVTAAERGTTVRVLVLEALKKAGYPVPTNQVIDRRRRV
jgi:hypothetical protein